MKLTKIAACLVGALALTASSVMAQSVMTNPFGKPTGKPENPGRPANPGKPPGTPGNGPTPTYTIVDDASYSEHVTTATHISNYTIPDYYGPGQPHVESRLFYQTFTVQNTGVLANVGVVLGCNPGMSSQNYIDSGEIAVQVLRGGTVLAEFSTPAASLTDLCNHGMTNFDDWKNSGPRRMVSGDVLSSQINVVAGEQLTLHAHHRNANNTRNVVWFLNEVHWTNTSVGYSGGMFFQRNPDMNYNAFDAHFMSRVRVAQ